MNKVILPEQYADDSRNHGCRESGHKSSADLSLLFPIH